MQRDQSVVNEPLEERAGEIDVESADHRARERDVPFEARSPGQVDDHPRQGLVQRHVGVAVAADARLVAGGARESLPEGDADVLDGVVRVDVQVALRLDLEVDQAVARDLVEHVIEERHPGLEPALAGAVEVDPDPDPGLGSVSDDFGASLGHEVSWLAPSGSGRPGPVRLSGWA